jgi:hypothetical protein
MKWVLCVRGGAKDRRCSSLPLRRRFFDPSFCGYLRYEPKNCSKSVAVANKGCVGALVTCGHLYRSRSPTPLHTPFPHKRTALQPHATTPLTLSSPCIIGCICRASRRPPPSRLFAAVCALPLPIWEPAAIYIRGKQTSSTTSPHALSTAPPAALGLTPVVARCANFQLRWNWFACSLLGMHHKAKSVCDFRASVPLAYRTKKRKRYMRLPTI